MNAPFRTLVVALTMAFLAAACGGDGDQKTLREIASSIKCTDLEATPKPSGNKEVLRVGTCTKEGDGVIITTYTSNEARDAAVRKMDDDVTALIDQGDRWTAFASPELSDVDAEDRGEGTGGEGSTCDAAREAFLSGTDDDIVAALEALQADRTAPAEAREYADYYLHGDVANPEQLEIDKDMILSACEG